MTLWGHWVKSLQHFIPRPCIWKNQIGLLSFKSVRLTCVGLTVAQAFLFEQVFSAFSLLVAANCTSMEINIRISTLKVLALRIVNMFELHGAPNCSILITPCKLAKDECSKCNFDLFWLWPEVCWQACHHPGTSIHDTCTDSQGQKQSM